jgi:hypothetical protein
VIVNLLAGQTREGRVIKKLLEKLELIRKQLRSDKVFDVVGRLFENVSLKSYLEMATTEEGERAAIEGIDGLLTDEQVRALEVRDQALFGGGDVKSHLAELNIAMEQEQYRRLLPGYIRRFVGSAAPLIDLRADGDLDGVFGLAPERPRAFDPVLSAMEFYPAEMQRRFTVYRPKERGDAIWLHPGEPVFDRFCATLLTRHGDAAQRGAIFIDPHTTAPYLFHLAQVSVVRRHTDPDTSNLFGKRDDRPSAFRPEIIESRLIGLRQESDGTINLCPIEHLLLLHGARNVAPGSVPLARLARGLAEAAGDWINKEALSRIVGEHRARIDALDQRLQAGHCERRAALAHKNER